MFACAVAAALSALAGVPTARARAPEETTPASVTDDTIGALHREGDAAFANDDFRAAQRAWTDAYLRISDGERWNYRATLLALTTNAALADFSVHGEQQPVRDAAALLDAALLGSALPSDLRPGLESERARLGAVLDPVRSEEEPAAEPEPEPEPEPPSPKILRGGSVQLGTGTVRPLGPHPSTGWLIGGGIAAAGGLAALGVGLSFAPRARRQVTDAGFSASEGPGVAFVDDEQGKGLTWVGVGTAVAVAGVAGLIIGAVSRSRSR